LQGQLPDRGIEFGQVKASALRADAGPAHAPGSAVARPARRTPGHFSSANSDQHGSSIRVRLVRAGHRHVIGGRGSAGGQVLCAVLHPLWIVPAGDGPVNPS